MKNVIAIIAVVLMALPSFTMAQKGKEVSPVIEGKQKVRKHDYDSIWRFTTFNGKSIYYCDFDYRNFAQLPKAREFDFGNFLPVMNYLTTLGRTPMLMCAVYAINPSVTDKARRMQLQTRAEKEAANALTAYVDWMAKEGNKNKIQIKVAQIDYRYWWGEDFFDVEVPEDEVISVGVMLFFGSRKINLFPSIAEGAPVFKSVKFFPNEAELLDSYDSLIKEVADYLKQNEKVEILLRGYSDNSGTEMYNISISHQRANEIKKALIRQNIPPHRIEIEAMGSENPVGDNSTREGRIENNRVEMIVQ